MCRPHVVILQGSPKQAKAAFMASGMTAIEVGADAGQPESLMTLAGRKPPLPQTASSTPEPPIAENSFQPDSQRKTEPYFVP